MDLYRKSRGVVLTTDLVWFHTFSLLEWTDTNLPDGQKISLKFSKGWAGCFKQRHQFRFRGVQSEALGADQAAIDSRMPELMLTLMNCSAKWRLQRRRIRVVLQAGAQLDAFQDGILGLQIRKSRITVLACSSNDCTEMFPLMVTSSVSILHCFKRKSSSERGMDYHVNKIAWITMDLFFQWLTCLHCYTGGAPGRKIFLLIENCSAHRFCDTLLKLGKVVVEVLPPNTTDKMQPLDAGIIGLGKARYKHRLLFRVFDSNVAEKNSK